MKNLKLEEVFNFLDRFFSSKMQMIFVGTVMASGGICLIAEGFCLDDGKTEKLEVTEDA